MQDSMDTDTASRPSLPQPSASHRRFLFPKGHGKTLAQAQFNEWFMALLKQHPSLEPIMKEGRSTPYLTANPWADAAMLMMEGFLGLILTPADPDAQQQMVIIHGMSTTINVDFLATPEAFLWLRRRAVAGELCIQLLGLVEGTMLSSVHLLGLSHFCVSLYTPKLDLCGHFCHFGHQH
ncbi:hypothetical protein E2C01_018213 [Portunus trituberculatus]|uniref:Uncharacterized protein n=1 Tax=Portunus trituberculatus TaxID=210409 RepID=A0A5B7DTX9_PORTR|nr:hypothetical protein [Portunus trituberculatus]